MKNKSQAKANLQFISNFISTFLVSIVFIIAIILVATRVFGFNMFSVESGSMTPTYPVDALVVVKSVEPSTIEVGDVVTYVLNEEGVLVTHRVVGVDKNKETFTTKGDANDSNDPSPILWGNVVGKVVIGFPKIGAVFRVVSAEENRTKIIAVLVAFGVISVGWDVIDKIKSKKRKSKTSSQDSETLNEKQTV